MLIATLIAAAALAADGHVVERQRVDHSTRSIVGLQLSIVRGVYRNGAGQTSTNQLRKAVEQRAAWLPDGQFVLSDIRGVFRLLLQLRDFLGRSDVQLRIDDQRRPFGLVSVLHAYQRLKCYVLDRCHSGSIEYDYSFSHRGLLVERYTRVEDNHLTTRVVVTGNIYSRQDWPRVSTTVNRAQLTIVADEQGGTTIRTTASLGWSQNYNARCRCLRAISRNVAGRQTPAAVSTAIDGQLATLAVRVATLADEDSVVNEWIDILSNMRLPRLTRR